MRLTNIHRVLLFDKSPWLKNYINFNNRQRKLLKSLSVLGGNVFIENKERRNEEGKGNVVKKYISHQDYVDCLFEERRFMHTMQTIRSFKHQIEQSLP